eukprot:scaffold1298_cov382-Prasinococcus_capsulatus_cf.AAC.11
MALPAPVEVLLRYASSEEMLPEVPGWVATGPIGAFFGGFFAVYVVALGVFVAMGWRSRRGVEDPRGIVAAASQPVRWLLPLAEQGTAWRSLAASHQWCMAVRQCWYLSRCSLQKCCSGAQARRDSRPTATSEVLANV